MNPDSQTTPLEEATRALKWIVNQYSDDKPSFQVAQDAYAMFSEARMALANIKAMELLAPQPAGPAELGPYPGYRAQVLEEAVKVCADIAQTLKGVKYTDAGRSMALECANLIRALKNTAPQGLAKVDAPELDPGAKASSPAAAVSEARALLQRWWDLYGGSTCNEKMAQADMEALDKDTEAFLAQPEAGADSSK